MLSWEGWKLDRFCLKMKTLKINSYISWKRMIRSREKFLINKLFQKLIIWKEILHPSHLETLIVCAINRPTKKMVKSVSFNPNFVFVFWTLYENMKILGNLLSCSRHQNNQIYEFRIPNILFTCLINSRARHSAIYKLNSRNLF